jgi:hypothetical protein
MPAPSRLLKATRIVGVVAIVLNAMVIVIVVGILASFGWALERGVPFDEPGGFGGIDMDGATAVMLAVIALVAGLVISLLMLLALRQVLRIVASAIAGDPFAPENAGRWTQVGWLALGIQLVYLVVDPAVQWAAPDFPIFPGHPSASLAGIMMVLLIFVVAQIFRRGAEMRQELEGTV